MATRRISIINWATAPDTSGNCYAELSSANLNANDLYPSFVWVFADTSTDIELRFRFQVPQDYVDTANIVLVWATTVTTGNVNWQITYDAAADGETFDPSAADQTVDNGATAVPGTARLLEYTTIAVTDGNFAAGDTVQGVVERQGSDTTNDTAAASVYLIDAFFEYADA